MDRRGESLVRPLLLAACLHILLILTFFIAVSPEAKTITPPSVVVIQATELTFAPSAAAEARVRKQKAEEEEKKRHEAEQKRRQQEAKRKAEAEREEQLEKAKLEAKKKAEVEAKKKAEVEAKKKAEVEAKNKAEAKIQAELKRAREAKQAAAKAEAEAKRKANEAARAKVLEEKAKATDDERKAVLKKERENEEKALEEAFKQAEVEARALEELKKKEEAELAVLNALAAERAAANVLDAMTTRITRAWRRPVAFAGGLEVYLRMALASNGELVDVRVVKSSGDVLFDRSALTAVQRAAPFNEVEQFDAATFEEKFRSLTVKFRPED
ncbi:MAG: protein TolA [Gammaproteobacteria bacterium]|nr:protein TolA [Gammaproteobacteria bacterium]